MKVFWSRHAKERFEERVLKHDLTYDEIELGVIEQKVRVPQGLDGKYGTEKYKTVLLLRGNFVTVEKAESGKMIYVITLWDSSEKEIELWKKKR